MVNHDRFGLFRPTANEEGETIHPEWSTLRNVHLDVSLMFKLCYDSTHLGLNYDINNSSYQYNIIEFAQLWHQ